MKTESRVELTLRGIVLGVVLTVVFTAANVYFGLKAGLTFSTSIPAVVLSMALLRWLGNTTAQENNIVQTVASTAGTLSSIIFVLPGFIMIGWWTGFPYWQSVAICATGGILGVMYSIPLRRALVTDSDLPYPEGTACAEVIKVGAGDVADQDSVESSGKGLKAVLVGSLVSALFLVSLLCILPICWLLWDFARSAGLGEHALLLTVGGIVIVVVVGFLVSTVCGY